MPRHPSDSTEQRDAESVLLAGLSARIGVRLTPRRLRLGEAAQVSIDGCSEDLSVIAELYAHIGETKVGQRHKIARDILKLVAIEAERQGRCRKILGFADASAVRYLQFVARRGGENVRHRNLSRRIPHECRDRLQSAQSRQMMVNR